MKENHAHCEKLRGVGCDVKSCVYNDMDCKACTAQHIKVENRAGACAEAACGTYTPRSQF